MDRIKQIIGVSGVILVIVAGCGVQTGTPPVTAPPTACATVRPVSTSTPTLEPTSAQPPTLTPAPEPTATSEPTQSGPEGAYSAVPEEQIDNVENFPPVIEEGEEVPGLEGLVIAEGVQENFRQTMVDYVMRIYGYDEKEAEELLDNGGTLLLPVFGNENRINFEEVDFSSIAPLQVQVLERIPEEERVAFLMDRQAAFKWVREEREDGAVVLHPTIIFGRQTWEEEIPYSSLNDMERLHEFYSLPGDEENEEEFVKKMRMIYSGLTPNHELRTMIVILNMAGRAKEAQTVGPDQAWQGFVPPVSARKWRRIRNSIFRGGALNGRPIIETFRIIRSPETTDSFWFFHNYGSLMAVDWPKGTEIIVHYTDKPTQILTSFADFETYGSN